MGFSVPELPKGGRASGRFLQPQPDINPWKGKKNGKRSNGNAMGGRRFDPPVPFPLHHNPPRQSPFESVEIPFQSYSQGSRNRLKRRRILARNKVYPSRAPLAPRNTTSFIMRAKKLGGIAPVVPPSPATPAIIPTPVLSPGLRDKGSVEEMNKELGVDGYGSMNGLIRLRSYAAMQRDVSESESDVDQGDLLNTGDCAHSVERLEQRIDEGLSRFEIIYPSRPGAPQNLENCVYSQERFITHLQENVVLKERLFVVEQELTELRQRVRELEGSSRPHEPMEEQCEESCGDVSTPGN